MNDLPLKVPTPFILAMACAATATLATLADAQFVEAMLDSATGLFAILCALIAVGRLARRQLTVPARALWFLVLAVALVVAGLEFAEPFAELKGHDFAIENADDVLLLLAGPIGLWLTSRSEPRPVAAQLLLVTGLAAQLCGAILDIMSDDTAAGLGLTPGRAESYADFAQFLSLLSYLMTLWLLVGGVPGTTAQPQLRASASRPSPYPPGLRDSLYPPPFLIGWGLADQRTPAGRVHRLCNQAVWPATHVLHSARNLWAITLWPFVASVRALRTVRHYGKAVERLTGKSRLRQYLEQVFIAVGYRITPAYYYVYELYRRGQWRRAPEYLMRYETKEIAFRLLYPFATDQYEPTPLKDKMGFARHCRAHNVRHAPVAMLFQDGARVTAPDFVDRLPQADLFVKPVLGKGGGGTELWRYAGNGSYRDAHGTLIDEPTLIARVAEFSRNERYLIQWAMKNHGDLLDLSAGALCTVRMLSCRNEAGDFEVTDAAFRMSVNPASPVDNFHAGGIAAAVDVATGSLGAATDLGKGPEVKWHDRHPLTGAQIAGRQLPMWRETVDLAVRAHRIFPDYVLVGWDIAILEDGPCVIEGNRGPDVDILQRTSRGPIGDKRFGELLAFNLEQRAGPR